MANTDTIEFSVEAAGPCRKLVKVKIPPGRVTEEFDKSLSQWTRTAPIPGFRQGKAPRSLIERRFGKQVAIEVKQSLLDAALEKALKSDDLAPISDPEMDPESLEVAKDEALDFDFTIFVKPEFELPPLDGITVEVPSADPTTEQIDGAVERILRRKATLRPVDDEIQTGDTVTLDVVASLDGAEALRYDEVEFEVGSRLVGELVTEGLDEALVGQKKGASAMAKGVVAPWQESHPLAGHEFSVTAEVLDHKRPELPTLDDQLAGTMDFDSKSDFMDAITRSLKSNNEDERDRLIENLALGQLAEKAKIELPEALIEKELDELSRRAVVELQMQDKPEDEIAKRVSEVREQRRDESVRELKAWFIVDKIVEKDRIIVPESEVREAVAQIAQYNNQAPDAMYEELRNGGRLSRLRNQLREKKARTNLRTKVQVTDLAPPEASGQAQAEDQPKKKKAGSKKKATTKKKTTKKKKEDA